MAELFKCRLAHKLAVLLGEAVERFGNSCEVLHKAAIVVHKTKELLYLPFCLQHRPLRHLLGLGRVCSYAILRDNVAPQISSNVP